MKTKFVPVLTVFMIILFVKAGASVTTSILFNDWPKVFDVQIEQKGSFTVLQWKAIDEAKEVYYEIESSTDQMNYKTEAVILGGFSADQFFIYSFKIKQAETKKYYRIKQKNNDGSLRIVSEPSM